MNEVKLIAFDLDGTLTQHKTTLGEENRRVLDAMSDKYKLLMVGAGQCRRIFKQMGGYPIDIIGNYGMQYCVYDKESKDLRDVFDLRVPCDRDSVERRITELRERHGYLSYKGDNVEYHDSGCVTFPLLGTEADIRDKLAFDPDRKKRSLFYQDVKDSFSDYVVFIGGSSSFDFAPKPYDKYYALANYCRDNGLDRSEMVYVGDDYGYGGNDESVYRSDIRFVTVDDYRKLHVYLKEFLK